MVIIVWSAFMGHRPRWDRSPWAHCRILCRGDPLGVENSLQVVVVVERKW